MLRAALLYLYVWCSALSRPAFIQSFDFFYA